jgi:hypothetical protein
LTNCHLRKAQCGIVIASACAKRRIARRAIVIPRKVEVESTITKGIVEASALVSVKRKVAEGVGWGN